MKAVLILALLTVVTTSRAFAAVEAADPREQTYTQGTAQLPTQVTVINNGVRKTYQPILNSNEFALAQDRVFQMGPAFHCIPPFLGKTAEAMDIPIRVQSREIESPDGQPAQEAGPVGAALLVVPEGTDVYGTCHGADLISLKLQVPSPSNFFEIAWKKLDVGGS